MKFYLCSATKNTFFFISEDEFKNQPRPSKFQALSNSEIAKVLCHHYGTQGADGFVIVREVKNNHFDYEWEFYNRDGSSAEMCGNASRCMAYFVKSQMNFQKSELKFNTLAGTILVKYLDNLLSVKMTEHQLITLGETLVSPSGEKIIYSFINTGVPHAVIEVGDLKKESLLPMVEIFRRKKEFGSAGANVSFIKKNPDNTYEGVTFERGVENFTASCGTGVVAMALSIFNQANFSGAKSIEIKTPGGSLNIDLDSSEKFCWLTGSAELIEVVEGWM